MRASAHHMAAFVLTLLALSPGLAAPATNTAADPALESRVQAVSAELRCLVCQNQNLADSHADLAVDLKNQVREQLRAGRTPEEVVTYMTERYGDFVRYRPPFKATTWLLWLGPGLLLVLGLLGLTQALRRHAASSGPPALSDAEAQRAASLLHDPLATGAAVPKDR